MAVPQYLKPLPLQEKREIWKGISGAVDSLNLFTLTEGDLWKVQH